MTGGLKDVTGIEPEEWDALLGASASDSVFLTWDWLDAWWRAYGGGRHPRLTELRDGGRLVGVAPFYVERERRFGRIPFETAALIGDGSGDSDYLDLIAFPGRERDLLERFLEGDGRAHGWEVIRLREIPESSPFLPLLGEHASSRGWHWDEMRVGCPYVDLPQDWDTYLRSLKPRMRTKIRSLVRTLESAHRVRLDMCRTQEDLDARLESLFDLHHKRWNLREESGVFESDAKRSFYADVSRRFLSRDWLRLYSLSVDDRWLAHQFCFERGGTVHLLQEGFDPEWIEKGVGNVLRALVFGDCIERGVKRYDFLGGVTEHKLSWGAEVKYSRRVWTAGRGLKTWVYFEAPRIYRKLRPAPAPPPGNRAGTA